MSTNEGAFEAELLTRLSRLRGFCLALTASPHDADDLLQTTVERLLTKRPPDDANLTKWMFRVCRNIWIDELRARKVRQAGAVDDLGDADMPRTDGERDALARVTLNEVSGAMARLSDDQRAVISLIVIEGFSYKEAADVLELPIGTIMSRLSRARAMLVDHFDKQEIVH